MHQYQKEILREWVELYLHYGERVSNHGVCRPEFILSSVTDIPALLMVKAKRTRYSLFRVQRYSNKQNRTYLCLHGVTFIWRSQTLK
jgi:hypothetical protein